VSVNLCLLAAVMGGLAVLTQMACASETVLIAEHVGARDPGSAEGGRWTAQPGRVGVRPVALRGKGPGVLDAWQVTDDGDGSLNYVKRLSKSDVKNLSGGFALSARLRVVGKSENAKTALTVRFCDGRTRWRLRFHSTTAGDPIVRLRGVGGDTVELTGAGPGYHLYEVKDLDGDGGADLYVDGVLTRGFWLGAASERPAEISWGTGAGGFRGNAAFNLVRLVAAPKSTRPRRLEDMDVDEKSIFETKTILMGKRRYCYVDEGKGTRVIVLIRGYRFCEKKWDKQIPVFAKAGYRVISPYRPGTGGSDYRTFISKATEAEDIYTLLDRLGVKRIVVLGHCGGTRVAWQMYLTRPKAIEAFISYDSGLFGRLYHFLRHDTGIYGMLKADRPHVERMDTETRALYEKNKESLVRFGRPWFYPSDFAVHRALRNLVWLRKYAAHRRKVSLQPDPNNLEPRRPKRCDAPVLSITTGWGRMRQDEPEAVALEETVRRRAPKLKLVVIANSSHYINDERPERFNNAILEFLASLPDQK